MLQRILFYNFLMVTNLSLASSAIAAEVDAIQFLNDALAKKDKITRKVTVMQKAQVCTRGPMRGPDGEAPEPYCRDTERPTVQALPDYARAIDSQTINVKNFKIQKENTTGLPENAIIERQYYFNCSTSSLTPAMSLSVSGTKGITVQKTSAIRTSAGNSTNIGIDFKWGRIGTTFNFSREISTSDSNSEASSETVTRNWNVSANIGPNKTGRFELIAYQTTIEIPFSAELVIDGTLEKNESGFTKASNLLNDPERTFLFSGIIRATNVSEGMSRNIEDKIALCRPEDLETYKSFNEQSMVPSTSLPDQAISESTKLSTFSENNSPKSTLARIVSKISEEGPSMGAPNGVQYEILYTSETSRMSPICGFNDIGLPNTAVYNVEYRKYRNFIEGKLIGEWQDSFETFKECRSV